MLRLSLTPAPSNTGWGSITFTTFLCWVVMLVSYVNIDTGYLILDAGCDYLKIGSSDRVPSIMNRAT
jgi:hypothetical protein